MEKQNEVFIAIAIGVKLTEHKEIKHLHNRIP